MQGKTVVITGATSGIGTAAALALAGLGARILFTARDEARARSTLAGLTRANPDAAHDYVLADLTTVGAMHAAAAALAAKAPRIDVLANNAGAMFQNREITADGLEKTFAVDHMAYFVVTAGLSANLASDARIVSTSSGGHVIGRLDLSDLDLASGYSSMGAYGRAKLCNILFTRELARRLAGTGVTANCFHPGGVNTAFGADTRGLIKTVFDLARPFLLTPEKGADTLVWLASSPEAAGLTGGYYVRRRLTQPSAAARDDDLAARLWTVSERFAGETVAA
jgi:NAD(P)-dependent dehydrogenase (short-subunit alcohol dehydrogenase family)